MGKISSVFIAVSLDGFIARKNGDIDWLDEANLLIPKDEDCGFIDFINSVDTIIMGRKTFEQVLTFDKWVYGNIPVIVLSKKLISIPKKLSKTVSCSSRSPLEIVKKLEENGVNKIYIDGGATIQSFLKENLIRDITITRIPIIIGDGISLFGSMDSDIIIRHVSTKAYEFGFVQSVYEVIDLDTKKVN